MHASLVKMTANASPKSHGQDHGFLGAFAACPTIPKHPYNKVRELWHRQLTNPTKANAYKSEWTLLTDIDNQTFTRDFLTEDLDQDEEEADLQKCLNWSSFDANLNLLLIRMPALLPHENVAYVFNEIFLEAVQPIRSLRLLGSTTYCGPNGEGGKQAAFSYAPRQLPPGRSRHWPSVMIEVSYSESGPENEVKLGTDVLFWLRAISRGEEEVKEVKVVLTLRVDRKMPAITIEKWEVNCHGCIHCTQQVIIQKEGISGEPLVVEFEKLFLRAGDGPQEQDIKMDSDKLAYLGEMIWETQEETFFS